MVASSVAQRLSVLALLVLVALPATAAAQAPQGRWVDADGNALPFASDAELAAFLEEAEVVANEKIGIGTTAPRRLTLEHNGVRLAAVFRDVDETHSRVRLADGSYFQRLRDYSGYEVAAYHLGGLLDIHNIPPAVHRSLGREDGTVQFWVEGAMMEGDRTEQGLRPPNGLEWARQVQEMLVFDELVGNVDRNPGNMLIDSDWRIWLIDHTRAFQQGDELRNATRIRMVRRGFWEALKALDRDAVEAAVDGEVDAGALDNLFKRRDLLVAHLQGLIDERGDGAVIWE